VTKAAQYAMLFASKITLLGKTVELHHVDQSGTGPVAEMSAARHDEFYSLLHDNTGQAQSKVHANGDAAWKKERRAYWVERAKDFP